MWITAGISDMGVTGGLAISGDRFGVFMTRNADLGWQ